MKYRFDPCRRDQIRSCTVPQTSGLFVSPYENTLYVVCLSVFGCATFRDIVGAHLGASFRKVGAHSNMPPACAAAAPPIEPAAGHSTRLAAIGQPQRSATKTKPPGCFCPVFVCCGIKVSLFRLRTTEDTEDTLISLGFFVLICPQSVLTFKKSEDRFRLKCRKNSNSATFQVISKVFGVKALAGAAHFARTQRPKSSRPKLSPPQKQKSPVFSGLHGAWGALFVVSSPVD